MDYTPKIAKAELKHGHYYKGRCRNAYVARWDANTQLFYYWREKFGERFIEEIHCPEDENRYDVFITEEDLTELHQTVIIIPIPTEGNN